MAPRRVVPSAPSPYRLAESTSHWAESTLTTPHVAKNGHRRLVAKLRAVVVRCWHVNANVSSTRLRRRRPKEAHARNTSRGGSRL